MIEPNELRIGNWVETKYPHGWEAIQITPDYFSNIGSPTKRETRPIPLTVDILAKPCFEYTGNGNMTLPLDENHSIDFIDGYVELGNTRDVIVGDELKIPITSLHQVQNLFYSLTGQELEIKL